jgi:hypothetical protein
LLSLRLTLPRGLGKGHVLSPATQKEQGKKERKSAKSETVHILAMLSFLPLFYRPDLPGDVLQPVMQQINTSIKKKLKSPSH